ncbi:hypothetical protein DSH68_13530, partial [Enterococcus faecium]|nr:hypothetical protein [Enterococcus faecium]
KKTKDKKGVIATLSHFTCSGHSVPSLKSKPAVKVSFEQALIARISLSKTFLVVTANLVLQAPFRRSGQALTTQKQTQTQ